MLRQNVSFGETQGEENSALSHALPHPTGQDQIEHNAPYHHSQKDEKGDQPVHILQRRRDGLHAAVVCRDEKISIGQFRKGFHLGGDGLQLAGILHIEGDFFVAFRPHIWPGSLYHL